jgi:hypothetical protein
VEKWRDPESERDVWIAIGLDAWPEKVPWSCAEFGLMILAEHVVDVAPLIERAATQGIAVACVWGPAAAVIEDEIVEHVRDDVVTTSHAYETIAETLEIFLTMLPVTTHEAACNAWCILATSPDLATRARQALTHRHAQPVRTTR